MKHYLLYFASSKQLENTRKIFSLLKAKKDTEISKGYECYRIEHTLLEGHIFYAFLIHEMAAIVPNLKQHPIDLLIFDERLHDDFDAVTGVEKIHAEVREMAQQWGPDFEFPASRIVCILEDTKDTPLKPFLLGRYQVRNVLIKPKTTTDVLIWIKDVLTHGLITSKNPTTGVALSGGGLEGFLFQIGCMYGINLALGERKLHHCESFSGVSSGSICAAILANKVPIKEVILAFSSESDIIPPIHPWLFFDLAVNKFLERLGKEIITWEGLSPQKWLQKVMRLIPTGVFKGDAAKDFFEKSFSMFGGTNTFAELPCNLFIGATDQDSHENVIFGSPGFSDMTISEALRASCALPPFFTPITIGDRHYIDGQITSSCNLHRLVDVGSQLIFIVDPLRPYDGAVPGTVDRYGGVFSIIQIIKALVYSRFRQTLEHVTERYPDVDFFVFQPEGRCAEIMAGSPMRVNIRTEIIELAIRDTIRKLKSRHALYAAKLEKYGFELKSIKELSYLENSSLDLEKASA